MFLALADFCQPSFYPFYFFVYIQGFPLGPLTLLVLLQTYQALLLHGLKYCICVFFPLPSHDGTTVLFKAHLDITCCTFSCYDLLPHTNLGCLFYVCFWEHLVCFSTVMMSGSLHRSEFFSMEHRTIQAVSDLLLLFISNLRQYNEIF